MSGEVRKRWLVVAAVLAIAQTASVTVEAQFFWDQQQQYRRSRPQSGGFFRNFFEPFNSRSRDEDYYGPPPQQRPQRQHAEQPGESSRAPAPRKTDSKVAPTTSIVVMGDDMADWLAYGLEDVFSDSSEIGIVRKNKLSSGLVRYDSKGDLDWWHVARDTLAQEKADYVIMMLGIGDRQDLREKDLAKEAETRAKEQLTKDEADKDKKAGQKSVKSDDADATGERAAQRKKASGPAEFRGDEWAKIYSRRIDDTIAALKSKGVPVIWVGLPPIRGARSTADVAYLNDLYRARAERAGIKYIDVWDGFADEAGKYSNYGPDYEGQVRRLRLSDGVFFTKNGAIKLARYVEHELSRYLSNRAPVALPSEPVESAPSGTKPTERPLTGPVVPLTGGSAPKDSDELLGGPGSSSIHGDASAAKVLAKGEPVAAPSGRADNFAWPNGSAAKSAPPIAPIAVESKPEATDPKAVPTGAASALASAPTDTKQQERKKGSAGKITQQRPPKKPSEARTQNPPQDDAPRPPRPIGPSGGQSGGFFGFGGWR